MKRPYQVRIAGMEYTIKSDADASYVQSLAALVDDRMRQVQKGAKTAPPHAVAVLAAMQLADDLVRERNQRAQLRKKVREKSRHLREYLDREVKS